MKPHGASGALLFVQSALVRHFAATVSPAYITAVYNSFHLGQPSPPPAPRLYDEPSVGAVSYFKLDDASIEFEIHSTFLLWTIEQEISAYTDTVQGRAGALVMGDIIERAFCPQMSEDDSMTVSHGGPALSLEPWLRQGFLTLPALPSPPAPPAWAQKVVPDLRITDMVQTDSRIGYSTPGLTYEVVTTWEITAESGI